MSGDGGARRVLPIEPLTRGAFAPYGEVIDCEGVSPIAINDGTSLKFQNLATVETLAGPDGPGRAAISLYRASPRTLPLPVDQLERHPLGSQAFVPLQPTRYLVVVAGSAEEPRSEEIRAFLVEGQVGVSFRAGVWHHGLLALEPGDYLVVDRAPDEGNEEIFPIPSPGPLVEA